MSAGRPTGNDKFHSAPHNFHARTAKLANMARNMPEPEPEVEPQPKKRVLFRFRNMSVSFKRKGK